MVTLISGVVTKIVSELIPTVAGVFFSWISGDGADISSIMDTISGLLGGLF